jgi:hypothetical protein
MTTTNSDIAAKQLNPTMGNRNHPVKELGGVFVTQPVYTVLGTEAEDDLIFLCNIPNGTKVLEDLSNVANDGVGGTSAIISIGTAGNPDKYASALDITAAGRDAFGVSGDDEVSSDPISVEAERGVYIKLTTLTASMTAGKLIKVNLYLAANS